MCDIVTQKVSEENSGNEKQKSERYFKTYEF
jgi:hypothetical protein